MYTLQQIEAAKENARLHGFNQNISDELATRFVEWFLDNQPVLTSDIQAIGVGLTGAAPNSLEKQIEWWQKHLGVGNG